MRSGGARFDDLIAQRDSLTVTVAAVTFSASPSSLQFLEGSTGNATITASAAAVGSSANCSLALPAFVVQVTGRTALRFVAGSATAQLAVRGSAAMSSQQIAFAACVSNDPAFAGVVPPPLPLTVQARGRIVPSGGPLFLDGPGIGQGVITITLTPAPVANVTFTAPVPLSVRVLGSNTVRLLPGQTSVQLRLLGISLQSPFNLTFTAAVSADPLYSGVVPSPPVKVAVVNRGRSASCVRSFPCLVILFHGVLCLQACCRSRRGPCSSLCLAASCSPRR